MLKTKAVFFQDACVASLFARLTRLFLFVIIVGMSGVMAQQRSTINILSCDSPAVVLDPGLSAARYLWSDGLTTPLKLVTNEGSYVVTATTFLNDIIVNGGFERGLIGFDSEYTNNQTDVYNEGTYAISDNPNNVHPDYSPCSDHTTGFGRMMVVNASSVPNLEVYCQNESVTSNSTYEFSTQIASVHQDNPAILQFSVNGVLLAQPFRASAVTCRWLEFYEVWQSGTATEARICIVNQNTGVFGNDFAIDDVFFREIRKNVVTFNVDKNETPYFDWKDAILSQSNMISLTIAPDGNNNSILWSSGEISETVNINVPEVYSVNVTNECGAQAQTVVTNLFKFYNNRTKQFLTDSNFKLDLCLDKLELILETGKPIKDLQWQFKSGAVYSAQNLTPKMTTPNSYQYTISIPLERLDIGANTLLFTLSLVGVKGSASYLQNFIGDAGITHIASSTMHIYSNDLNRYKSGAVLCSQESAILDFSVNTTPTIGNLYVSFEDSNANTYLTLIRDKSSETDGSTQTYHIPFENNKLAKGQNTVYLSYELCAGTSELFTETYDFTYDKIDLSVSHTAKVACADILLNGLNNNKVSVDFNINADAVYAQKLLTATNVGSNVLPSFTNQLYSLGIQTISVEFEDVAGCKSEKDYSFEVDASYLLSHTLSLYDVNLKQKPLDNEYCEYEDVYIQVISNRPLSSMVYEVNPLLSRVVTITPLTSTPVGDKISYVTKIDKTLMLGEQVNTLSVSIEYPDCPNQPFDMSQDFVFYDQIPVANFTYTVNDCDYILLSIDDISQSSKVITKRNWDVGGDSFSNVQNLTFSKTAETLPVSLLVEDEKGCKAQKDETIQVIDKRKLNLKYENLSACLSETVMVSLQPFCRIKNTSQVVYTWTLNGANLESNQNAISIPPFSLEILRTNTLSLEVNIDGREAYSVENSFNIDEILIPDLDFFLNAVEPCAGNTVSLVDYSQSKDSKIIQINWYPDYDNNPTFVVTSTSYAPAYYPSKSGELTLTYRVLQRVVTRQCTFQASKTLRLYNTPVIDVLSPTFYYCISDGEEEKQLIGTVVKTEDIGVWKIDITNTSIATSSFFAKDFDPGFYNITFELDNGYCKDSQTTQMEIKEGPVLSFDQEAFFGENYGRIELSILDREGDYKVKWSRNVGADNINVEQPTVKLKDKEKFDVKVTDQYGCFLTTSTVLRVWKPFIPNWINPNSTYRVNSTIDLQSIVAYFPHAQMYIYDITGIVIYKSIIGDAQSMIWDGKDSDGQQITGNFLIQVYLNNRKNTIISFMAYSNGG